jgi:hypothetical protein
MRYSKNHNTFAVRNDFLKSLPTSLFQREEKPFPPFLKGDEGGFGGVFKTVNGYKKSKPILPREGMR